MKATSFHHLPRDCPNDQSSFYKYHLKRASIQKPYASHLETKASPRSHLLNESQLSNYQIHPYQKGCYPQPNSPTVSPFQYERDTSLQRTPDDASSTSMSVTPLDRSYGAKSQGVLSHHWGVMSANTRPCSGKSSMRSPEVSYLYFDGENMEDRGFSQNSNILKTPKEGYKYLKDYSGSPYPQKAVGKKVSPKFSPYDTYGSSKGYMEPNPQKQYFSQKDCKDSNFFGNQVTFRTNSAARMNTDHKAKEEEERIINFAGYSDFGGFTTFRGSLNKENIQKFSKENVWQTIMKNQKPYMRKADTEGDIYDELVSTQRVQFASGNGQNRFSMREIPVVKEKENPLKEQRVMKERRRVLSMVDTRLDSETFPYPTNACPNEEMREKVDLRKRQKSVVETPREKSTLDLALHIEDHDQMTPIYRGNTKRNDESADYKQEPSEEAKLKKMVMELRKKLCEKDVEIKNLKNNRKSNRMENNELNMKVSQVVMTKKRSDDILEQMSQQISCQEREIIFLQKCKERLESVLPNPGDLQIDSRNYVKKLQECEKVLKQKEKEAQELKLKVSKIEEESQGKLEEERSSRKTEARKLALEIKVREQEIKQLKEAIEKGKIHLLGFEKVGERIITLEHTQNQLIIENDRLKNLLPPEEKEKFQKYLEDKVIASKLIRTANELNTIDDYAKNLMIIIEAILRGKQPPIEAMKGINMRKDKSLKPGLTIEKAALSKNIHLRSLTRNNAELAEIVQQRFLTHMDEICDLYARVCGNICNMQ